MRPLIRGEARVATIYLLNGPNLDMLGVRETAMYGHATLAEIEQSVTAAAARHGHTIVARQTNAEHEMIEYLHEARTEAAGVIINPAGFSYHAVAVLDALKMCPCPIIEVHITNLHKRDEKWRVNSIISAAATGSISGLGAHGYVLALEHIAHLLAN
jgi:3-dehydroquinate dehydratase II